MGGVFRHIARLLRVVFSDLTQDTQSKGPTHKQTWYQGACFNLSNLFLFSRPSRAQGTLALRRKSELPYKALASGLMTTLGESKAMGWNRYSHTYGQHP